MSFSLICSLSQANRLCFRDKRLNIGQAVRKQQVAVHCTNHHIACMFLWQYDSCIGPVYNCVCVFLKQVVIPWQVPALLWLSRHLLAPCTWPRPLDIPTPTTTEWPTSTTRSRLPRTHHTGLLWVRNTHHTQGQTRVAAGP